MSLLSESFSSDFLKTHNAEKVVECQVFKSFVLKADKTKRWIIVALSNDRNTIGFILINSQVNPNVFPTQDLKDLHLHLIKTKETPYLDHNSYADCSCIEEMTCDAIRDLLDADSKCHIGTIEKSVLREIKKRIKAARTIPLKVKKKFGLF